MNTRTLATLILLGLPAGAQAANWLQLQGNEPPNTGYYKFWGFLQPTYTYIDADPISGLAGGPAAFNGELTLPNRIGPDLDDNDELQFNRARLGVRGNLIPGKINYFLLADAGRNALTIERDVVLTDASVTFNYIPGARIRVGQFKLPTSEEALVAVHVAYPYVYYSNAATSLLIERHVRSTGAVNATGASSGEFVSAGSGFRDIGVQVYDWFNQGPWEFSYALMISNGNETEELSDDDGNKDVTGRLQASYIFNKSKGPNREDASVWLWHQNGEREFGGQDFDRIREGVGARYQKGPWRATAEYLRGEGVIVAGPNPPFPDQPVQIGLNEKADGWYVEGGWRFLKGWEVDLRYDTFDRMTESADLERQFNTTTLGLNWYFYKNTRLTLNYEWRDLEVSNPSAITNATQLSNAQLIADNLGDRASVQLTWFF
ncbi:MAG TPA: porin [Thiobacillus sp.]|nr:porin [Thiobacillus sp.]